MSELLATYCALWNELRAMYHDLWAEFHVRRATNLVHGKKKPLVIESRRHRRALRHIDKGKFHNRAAQAITEQQLSLK